MTDEDDLIRIYPPTVEELADWLTNPWECGWCGKTAATGDEAEEDDWHEITASPMVGGGYTCPPERYFSIVETWKKFCTLRCAGEYLIGLDKTRTQITFE